MNTKSTKILLVEDNPGDVRLVKEMLIEENESTLAHSSFDLAHIDQLSEAIILLTEKVFDAVLLDLSLPDSQGLDTFNRMYNAFPGIPIIVMSGYDNDELTLRAVQKGAQDYLVKGQVDRFLLVRAIRYAIERKQTEKALRQAEMKYRSIFENAVEGIYQSSLDGNFLTVNPKLAQIYGYNSSKEMIDDVLNIKDQLYVDPERRTEFIRLIKTRGNVTGFESQMYRKDGKVIWVSENGRPIYDTTGEVLGYEGSMEDITERKQAEEALKHAKERYRHLFEEAPVMYVITQKQEGIPVIMDCNELFLRTLGYTRAEVLERPLADFYTSESKAKLEEGGYQQALKKGFVGQERDLVSRDGCVIKTLLQAVPVTDSNGGLLGTQATYVDITERKRAEERIREQATLLDKAQDAIIVQDLEDHITYINNSAEHLYGWTVEEAIGSDVNQLINIENSDQIIKAKKIVIEKKEWNGTLRQLTKDQKEIIVESRWTLVEDSNMNPKSILIINTDISEKKKLEGQFFRAQRMESIGTLASGIAHDLNNILSPILMALQSFETKFTEEGSLRILKMLELNAKRGANIVKQLLTFARGVEGEYIQIQLKHLIKEIEITSKETFPKSIRFISDYQKDLWIVSGDVTQLQQVLLNLCVNARDAMPKGGTLRINAENMYIDENYSQMHHKAEAGPYILLSVSDTGMGIHPEIIDKIYEPFFTTKKIGEGTGLGLSTSLGIIESHGGFINVNSEVGEGTEFKIYLPADNMEQINEQEEQSKFPKGHGELILVVDDERTIREVTKVTLESFNYTAIAGNDGTEAIALYTDSEKKIDIVLLDMMMPYMDGPTTIRALQKLDPNVKIIAASGLKENEKLPEIDNPCVKAFLIKPYTADKLLIALEKVLNGKAVEIE